ncbi:MAG: 23S rRNA (uracil(1939)-C(5))-methyltransferase RlmD, partial [Synergistaceae bacterium]|nr:23S rRNA (uracil(1939)-C(5))-methyltransferase RlmD [Synergistaceae bacterium]
MKEKEILKVEIDGISSEGEGVARYGEERKFVVFVTDALPGERVKCRVVKIGKNYATARMTDIERVSADRTEPRCPSFARCGGCQLQHTSYGAQISIKGRILSDALERIGRVGFGGVTCVPSPDEWGYRNKVTFPVGTSAAGYYERRSHRIVPLTSCPVLTPFLERAAAALADAVKVSGLRGYDEKTGAGDIRAIAARSGLYDGHEEVIAAVVAARELTRRETGALRDACQRAMSHTSGLSGVALNINTSRGNFIWGPVFRPLCGKKYVRAELSDFVFDLDISSFFQVNAQQAESMFGGVREILNKYGSSRILELYGGVGSLTAYLAGASRSVDMVEEWRPASRLAAVNMQKNAIGGVRIFGQSAESYLADAQNSGEGKYDTVVADPPRTGLTGEVVRGIGQIAPEMIVYISCNPATLARDVAMFVSDWNYKPHAIEAYDMFPQTAHVESICVLERLI